MREQELRDIINRCTTIIEGLENYDPFKMMIEDFNISIQMADNSWHTVSRDQHDKLDELRITKLAAVSIINTIDIYKHDKEEATKELAGIEHPDKVQNSYVDNE